MIKNYILDRIESIEKTLGEGIIKTAKWQYVLNIGVGIFGAIFLLVLGKSLGSHDFGVFAINLAIPTVAFGVFDARLQECVLYFFANRNETLGLERILRSIYLFDLISKCVAFSFSILVGYFLSIYGFSGANLFYITLASLTIIGAKLWNAPAAGVLRATGKLELYSKALLADWILRALILCIVIATGYLSISVAFLLQIPPAMLCNALAVRQAMNRSSRIPKVSLHQQYRDMVQTIIRYKRLIFSSQAINIADIVVKDLDIIICSTVLNSSSIGIYKMTKSFVAVSWRLVDPIIILILPRIASLYASGDKQKIKSVLNHLILALFAAACFLYFTSSAFLLLAGEKFVGPEYIASFALYPYAAAWIIIALPLSWTHPMSVAAGKPDIQMIGGLIGNAFGLLAIWLGVTNLGLIGAASGLSLAYCLPFIFAFIILRRKSIIV